MSAVELYDRKLICEINHNAPPPKVCLGKRKCSEPARLPSKFHGEAVQISEINVRFFPIFISLLV